MKSFPCICSHCQLHDVLPYNGLNVVVGHIKAVRQFINLYLLAEFNYLIYVITEKNLYL